MFTSSLIFGMVSALNAISSHPWTSGGRRASLALKVFLFATAVLVLLLFLSKGISHLKDRVDNGQLSLVETHQSVLHQLAELDVEVAKGAQVRARAHWIEEGESSSAYFFRLEKKRSAERWISAIRE